MKQYLHSIRFWVCLCAAFLLLCAILHAVPPDTSTWGNSEQEDSSFGSINATSSGITNEPKPQAQSKPEPKKLDIAVTANEKNELVFDFTIADFVTSYDGFYWQDYNALYFPPSSRWVSYTRENAPHSTYESDYYSFQQDPAQSGPPIIAMYLPKGETTIQTITLDFDDHGYTPQRHADYKLTCFYTLKVLFPELGKEAIKKLVDTLDGLARGNMGILPYGNGVLPEVLYYKGDIGLYPYFCRGESARICIAPVSQQYLNQLAAAGVALHEIAAS